MASIATDKERNRRIVFTSPSGARKTVYLGKVAYDVAKSIKKKIEAMLVSIDLTGEIDPEIPRWLARHPKLARKLSKVGIVAPTAGAASARAKGETLAAFIVRYTATRTDVKPNTLKTWRQTRALLIEHFGEPKHVARINELAAKGFHAWLQSAIDDETEERRFSAASVTKYLSLTRQFFAAAVDARLITANPFRGIKLGKKTNRARQRFIDRELIGRVLKGCTDPEFKLVIALSRYGGLRIPSELDSLLWQHIDQKRGRILVTSPKTERYEGGESREIPLFPELVPFIEEWWKATRAEPRACCSKLSDDCPVCRGEFVFVSNRGAESAWRTRMFKLLRKLKITEWPKVFHNLRASRQTELEDHFPTHVVCGWMGNSESVADDHYLTTTDDHFRAGRAGFDAHPVSENRRAIQRAPLPQSSAFERNRPRGKRKTPGKTGDFAKNDGGGWESNPPGVFADATPGLKPVAVTRAAYTPGNSAATAIRTRHQRGKRIFRTIARERKAAIGRWHVGPACRAGPCNPLPARPGGRIR